jgi:hypothetical protein
MLALMQQFGALLAKSGTSFQPGVTGRDVTDEAGLPPIAAPAVDLTAVDAAKAAAAMAGTEMKTSLAITATPSVVTTQITAARREVAALAAELRAIPGLSQAASDNANRARVDYGGVHADTD